MKPLFAFLAAVLLLGGTAALAGEQPYTPAAYEKLMAAGEPFAVDFHADWCPTCRAQAPIIKDLVSTPGFKNLTVLVADYDQEHALRKTLNVAQQSTVVVFRKGKEVARSTGDTSRTGLEMLLRQAIS